MLTSPTAAAVEGVAVPPSVASDGGEGVAHKEGELVPLGASAHQAAAAQGMATEQLETLRLLLDLPARGSLCYQTAMHVKG